MALFAEKGKAAYTVQLNQWLTDDESAYGVNITDTRQRRRALRHTAEPSGRHYVRVPRRARENPKLLGIHCRISRLILSKTPTTFADAKGEAVTRQSHHTLSSGNCSAGVLDPQQVALQEQQQK